MAITTNTTAPLDVRRGYAMLIMVAGSVAISFGGLVQRNIEVADTWQINVYRSLGTLLAAALIIAIQHRGRVMKSLLGVGRFGLLAGVMLSFAGVGFVQALAHTTVANALFILGAIPFIAALFARLFLGERLRQSTLFTMIIAACGLGIMVSKGISAGSGFGNAMALMTAVSFAIYAVILRYKRQTDMIPVLLISSLIIIVIALFVSGGKIDVPLKDILLSLFWGGCLSGFVNWMFIIASRHLAAAEVTLIMMIEFALGPVWVWLFINETPSIWTIVGGSLVIAAVSLRAILELIYKPRPQQTPQQPV